ncbi:MAG TPA: ABC transporter permease, partial [Candidatus Binatia bacterium]
MKSFNHIIRLGVKELRSLWADKLLLIFVLVAFTLLVYSGAKGTSRELHNAPIAVVDQDRSPLSGHIVGAFYGPYFKTPEIIAPALVDPGLDEGRYTFVLDIPPNFQREVLAGQRPALQVNIDATRMTQAFIGANYIQNIVAGEVDEFIRHQRREPELQIKLVTHVKFNPNLSGLWFGGMMEIIEQITMLSIILTGAALIREREHGTIEHLLVMPLTPFEIMTAKVWANGLVILIATALSVRLVIQELLQVPIAGSVSLFLLGTALYL